MVSSIPGVEVQVPHLYAKQHFHNFIHECVILATFGLFLLKKGTSDSQLRMIKFKDRMLKPRLGIM